MGTGTQTPSQLTYSGANREPSFPNSQAFSLHRVNYPTGGSSIFNYEANTYDYNRSASKQLEFPQQVLVTIDTIINIQSTNFTGGNASGVIDFSKLYPVIASGGVSGSNATINIAFISTNHSTGWPPGDVGAPGKLSLNFNGNITDISSSGLTISQYGDARSMTYPYVVSLASSTAYTWSAHWDSGAIPPADFSLIHFEVTFLALKTVAQSNPTLTAGGLRIQSIVDSTATGIAKQRIWNYHYGSTGQYSNGVLMSMPSYVRNEEQPLAGGEVGPVMVLFSSSNTATTSAISGNVVGYSHVTETTVNPSNSADNGKIVYSYVNTPDSIISYNTFRMPGIPNMGNNLNGSELSRITYRNNSGSYWKLVETDNRYHTANQHVYYSAKYRKSQFAGNPAGNCNGFAAIPNAAIVEFFPSIKSEKVLMDTTYNITYDPADTTKFVTTVSVNYYDNPAHYLPTRSQVVDSKGNIHVSKTTYPQDYIVSGGLTNNIILDSLIHRNMVAESIEKSSLLYYASAPTTAYVTSANESRYKQLTTGSKAMVLDKVFKLDIPGPVTNFTPMSISGNTYSHDSRYRQLISFDTYDGANNINQYTQLYQPPVSILWDYRNVSPIAQVKGAVQADIAYTSFEADGAGNWTIGSLVRDSVTAALTGTKSYNLSNGTVSKTGLTSATTYVVSYWTKNSSPLTITGTINGYPVKGAGTPGGWTYYEHQVTGVTTITLSGTGNIDEVRLYPQSTEMTSYTYNPVTGVSSMNDARAGINFYEYDSFQRLLNIKDMNGNIVKSYVYHYTGQ